MPWLEESKGLDCPNCGQLAMTFGERRALGVFRTRACAHCGARVALPWWSLLVLYVPIALPALGIFALGAWAYHGITHVQDGLMAVIYVPTAVVLSVPLLIAIAFWWGRVRGVRDEWPLVLRKKPSDV